MTLALLALLGCESPPSATSLSEWTPGDHDRTEQTTRASTPQAQAAAAQPKQMKKSAGRTAGEEAQRLDPVIEATWAQQCATCHGVVGHGDGPTGPMYHAADLTLPDWQASATDAQITAVILNGNGKMPAFPSLPAKIVSGLVARIRTSRGH